MDDICAIFAGLLHNVIHVLAENNGGYTTANRLRHLARNAQRFQRSRNHTTLEVIDVYKDFVGH
jgi:hypothetical protein